MVLKQKYKKQLIRSIVILALVTAIYMWVMFSENPIQFDLGFVGLITVWIGVLIEFGISYAKKEMLDDLLNEYDLKSKQKEQ
jgi:hypothetical protein